MRHVGLAFWLFAALAVTAPTLVPVPAAAQVILRPNMALARTAFSHLSSNDRLSLYLWLMATGDFNAMISDNFGPRLYDAIASFQQSQGLDSTGIADQDTMGQLNAKGGVILRSWGMHFVDHPFADASLFIPGTFGLVPTKTSHGLAFENPRHSISLDFAFFAENEASMAEIFSRLSTTLANRRIDFAVIRDGFFAVAGGGQNYGTYSRYIPIEGGTVGFTATWNTNMLPNANRIAVVMANGLLPSRSQPDLAASNPSPPAALPPAALPPVAPPQQASLEAPTPAPPATVTVTGSAFFVSADGDLVTNNHVVKGCETATIVGRGTARIVAKDPKNDLALLRLNDKPTDPIRPATFRNAPLQLGETVYALGFPYGDALDNGMIFTNGMVSSAAGIGNDTTEFQMTAAIQPGNSGGPVLDGSGNLLGVTVARMNDVATLEATHALPQSVNFGIKGDIVSSFLRVNGVEPKMSTDTALLQATQIAASGKTFTAQVMCVRAAGGMEKIQDKN